MTVDSTARGRAVAVARPDAGDTDARIAGILRAYWGFESLRPLQAEAIRAGIDHRDALVVLPTGGGKSLCYQVPPLLVEGRMDVVISPLISLMKDQVDGLRQNGYPAAALHSGLDAAERAGLREGVLAGRYRLLFVSPERLVTSEMQNLIARLDVRAFAIDEAHCISQWGHDFRPEYRQLAVLRDRFPAASVHAFTATATPRVRDDIIAQLDLRDPCVLVGTFDRPNLVYRVHEKGDVLQQTLDAIRRHDGEAVIVYCISRKDTETMAGHLAAVGVRAAAYHAGLAKEVRARVQEDFAAERLDVVVATVAFGMGIDRSNVRCVIHASMPKSIEHFQQETGRAGRDGLEAECVLFSSFSDVRRWERLIERSAAEQSEDPDGVIEAGKQLLRQMSAFCRSAECRHRALSRYFGQTYPRESCDACDVCLGEVEAMEGSLEIAQKILSCVYRTGQRYGVRYVCEVLHGARTATVMDRGHDRLSVHGLLRTYPLSTLQQFVYQLVEQGYLAQTPGDRPVVELTADARPVLRGERQVRLVDPVRTHARSPHATEDQWAGVDRDLFEHLRALRRECAEARGVPPYVVFADTVLRSLAARRPSTLAAMRAVHGIGERKLAEFGSLFAEAIHAYCIEHDLAFDVPIDPALPVRPAARPAAKRPNETLARAMDAFARGASVAEVRDATGRAESTAWNYLAQYIESARPASIATWVDAVAHARVLEAARRVDRPGLSPIFEALEGTVPYNVIRIVLAHARAMAVVDAETARAGSD
ncbi:MAG: DNA helicase RecQ [Phycisphaeraceae bacterium]|nr:DNA helicase RecQ [Phycisphaeraceae bacterium]